MFIIRQTQMNAFQKKLDDQLIETIMSNIQKNVPDFYFSMENKSLKNECQHQVNKALENNFTFEKNIFVFVMFFIHLQPEPKILLWFDKMIKNSFLDENQKSILIQLQYLFLTGKKLHFIES